MSKKESNDKYGDKDNQENYEDKSDEDDDSMDDESEDSSSEDLDSLSDYELKSKKRKKIYEYFVKVIYDLDEDKIRDTIMALSFGGNELYKVAYGEVLVLFFRRKREANEEELKLIKRNHAEFMLVDEDSKVNKSIDKSKKTVN